MVCDKVETVVNISRPCAIEYLASYVVAEPVDACHPDLIAVHINDLCLIVDMEPVVMILVGSCDCFFLWQLVH